MSNPIEFYFDFSSPYGYFSSEKIEQLAQRCGRTVIWRPYLMGAVMKITERKPLIQIPMLNEYGMRDLKRIARYENISFRIPSQFPIATVAACRAYYWLSQDEVDKAKELAHALFRAYFVDDQLISKPETVIGIASKIGIDPSGVETALQDDEVKLKVREVTDSAIEQSIFGSPFFIVDGEPFWGHDRLEQVEAWAKSGGW